MEQKDGPYDLPGCCQRWESTCVSMTTFSEGFLPDTLLSLKTNIYDLRPHHGWSLLLKYKGYFLDFGEILGCNLNVLKSKDWASGTIWFRRRFEWAFWISSWLLISAEKFEGLKHQHYDTTSLPLDLPRLPGLRHPTRACKIKSHYFSRDCGLARGATKILNYKPWTHKCREPPVFSKTWPKPEPQTGKWSKALDEMTVPLKG